VKPKVQSEDIIMAKSDHEEVMQDVKPTVERIAKTSKGKKVKVSAPAPRPSSPLPPPPINMTNLWWSSKFSLPCIFYGHTGDEFKDSFVVRPICCSTFHYELKVRVSELDVLTEDRLKMCNDERTREFASALLGFIEWETRRVKPNKKRKISKPTNVLDDINVGSSASEEFGSTTSFSGASSSEEFIGRRKDTKNRADGVAGLSIPYPWPDFVYDLVVYRDKWAIWKKTVERSMRGNSKHGARKQAYQSA
jgi:hypothetical protein